MTHAALAVPWAAGAHIISCCAPNLSTCRRCRRKTAPESYWCARGARAWSCPSRSDSCSGPKGVVREPTCPDGIRAPLCGSRTPFRPPRGTCGFLRWLPRCPAARGSGSMPCKRIHACVVFGARGAEPHAVISLTRHTLAPTVFPVVSGERRRVYAPAPRPASTTRCRGVRCAPRRRQRRSCTRGTRSLQGEWGARRCIDPGRYGPCSGP